MRSARSSHVRRSLNALGSDGLVARRATGSKQFGLRVELALDFAHHNAQDRALALDGLLQPPKLFGVRVAAGLAPQLLALLGERLLECDARALGRADHLVAGNLQQPAVHWMGDSLFHHRRVDDHALEFSGLDGFDLHRRLDGGFDQQLQPLLADGAAKATDLRGIAWQPGLEVVQPTEELPVKVLAPPLDQFLIADQRCRQHCTRSWW